MHVPASTVCWHARTGIYGVLAEQSELEDAVVATGIKGMYFLDAEPHIPNPADILSSRRFRRFLENAQKTYDYVLLDTPPVGTFVDAAVISSLVDATALVVREGYTKRQDVAAAYEQLKKADANVIGAIMNFCETESSEYYYAYYNKDGKRVRKENYAAPEPAPMPAMRGHSAAAAEQGAAASDDIQSGTALPLPSKVLRPLTTSSRRFRPCPRSAATICHATAAGLAARREPEQT